MQQSKAEVSRARIPLTLHTQQGHPQKKKNFFFQKTQSSGYYPIILYSTSHLLVHYTNILTILFTLGLV